jgi:DNA repair protein RecO (recombination protein O)
MATVSGDRQRQDAHPAFVLHTFPFRETSLVVEVFTRNAGRVGLVARGARRPKSALRGLLMAFQPLLLSWAGKSNCARCTKPNGRAAYRKCGAWG